mmetsp:Transcript_9991/g.40505  ORF Transcript_9991/g.40505 Transcript_9991/m.40505 type:complete len:220 (+) Transcript_9991:251-910(+)|eukprot:CAMPEP_0185693456 /NCGR_PEP_ID=MMETSP1164-20130828/3243_1 /TAXON_ID=1104430 /ORGANISM="Chrysoreinhardia sp, Strain CCMP2950" /LENGTH=219 /DNA_ID=CAMNT_0028360249 /DNA_START=161 /DNA_END=820 /DNA_ORIENTATION=+
MAHSYRLGEDADEHEAVPALAADGLDGGRRDARLGRDGVDEGAHALDARVVGVRVDDLAVAHDVVDDDERARPAEAQRLVEVGDVALLVGVDEGEIEGLVSERRERGDGVPRAHVDDVPQARGVDVRARERGALRVELERDDAPHAARAAEPDRRVRRERADLEHGARADRLGEQLQQLALRRRDLPEMGGSLRLCGSSSSSSSSTSHLVGGEAGGGAV